MGFFDSLGDALGKGAAYAVNSVMEKEKKEVINELKHIFREKDIKKMFKSFKENNFKKNPVCEFILKNET